MYQARYPICTRPASRFDDIEAPVIRYYMGSEILEKASPTAAFLLADYVERLTGVRDWTA
jgi:hypothetical protein